MIRYILRTDSETCGGPLPGGPQAGPCDRIGSFSMRGGSGSILTKFHLYHLFRILLNRVLGGKNKD